ncbi:MAG: DNA mismatch repair endonuclease MutL [Bacteroidales bacterium]|nr:DNA mismatch repair endonuclease MutL [Bacteroidales bacterium]
MIDHVIHILPDAVANQIAAGEVVQRPASVVKELMENAIDAFAKNIKVHIKDGGKTSIQIMDDGMGMSEVDARLAFERHATSKISEANDLFSISTFGFRGEALAAISSVAQVELQTRKEGNDLGFKIELHGSKLINQEPIVCQQGSIFTVKNLFYNIPARRRFLKSDIIEFKHILDEFHRIAMAHPTIAFSLTHNDTEIYSLSPTSLKQRIIHIFGKNLSNELVDINVDTSIITIRGFIGKPEYAKKKSGLQFFFVNNRYMRHPFLYRVILNAYENLLLPETLPSYFIFFECDPNSIDVNIHPTKTEIKFEDERAVSQILEAAVRQTLGKTNILPNIDFENESSIKLPNFSKNQPLNAPKIQINPNYNPFEQTKTKQVTKDWQKLFEQDTPSISPAETQHKIPLETYNETGNSGVLQIKNQYLLVPVKSGIMLIDQYRAHVRILYEILEEKYKQDEVYTEKLIFPEILHLPIHHAEYFKSLIPHLKRLGFIITTLSDGQFNVEGIPSYWSNFNLASTMEHFIHQFEESEKNPEELNINEMLVQLARSSAIKKGQSLSENERQHLFDSLFSTSQPQYTPDGKTIFHIIPNEDIDQLFK